MDQREEATQMEPTGERDVDGAPQAPVVPPPPPPPRHGLLGTAWGVIGAVTGLVMLVVPGVFAIRSLLRWRRGSIRRPTFAWVCAWICVPLLAFGGFSAWALYNLPLVDDDFSDPDSGWLTREGPDWSTGYHEGAYRIELHGAPSQATGLVWSEGRLPNVAVEAVVVIEAGDPATTEFGIGCVDDAVGGYFFAIGPGATFTISEEDAEGVAEVATGDIPPGTIKEGANTIRGECRAGYGDSTTTMYLNGTALGEAVDPDDGDEQRFNAVVLAVTGPSDQGTIDVRFDDVRVIAVQPS